MKPKFRALDKISKKMFPVMMIDFGQSYVMIEEINGLWCERDFDEIELMSSTGLKDKNGKEIFEGDIVKFSDCDDDVYVTPVVWDKNYLEEFYTELKDIEVVGNIYDNLSLIR